MSEEKPDRPYNSAESSSWHDLHDLQLQRFHHIQAQARGLIGILLTLIVISISAYSVLSPLPSVPASLESYAGPATDWGVYPLTGLITASFSGGMAIIWLYWGAYCWLVSLHKLYRILLIRDNTAPAQTILIPSSYSRTKLINDFLDAEEGISNLYREFVRGALRIAIGLFFVVSAYQMYTYATQQRLLALFAMNLVFALPGIVLLNITNRVHHFFKPNSSEEFFDPDTGMPNHEILGLYQNRLSDRILSIITTLTAFLVLLSWILSWLWRWAGI